MQVSVAPEQLKAVLGYLLEQAAQGVSKAQFATYQQQTEARLAEQQHAQEQAELAAAQQASKTQVLLLMLEAAEQTLPCRGKHGPAAAVLKNRCKDTTQQSDCAVAGAGCSEARGAAAEGWPQRSHSAAAGPDAAAAGAKDCCYNTACCISTATCPGPCPASRGTLHHE